MQSTLPYMHTDYTVVEASTTAALITDVKEKIAEGWIPIGGVSVGLLNVLYQAMTKTRSI